MRIVVTGASGNVGSSLLRRLVSSGEHDVVGIARRPPTDGHPFDQVHWVPLDLTNHASPKTLRKTFRGADAVVHLAWGFQPSHDVRYLEELGVGGTRRVLDAITAADVQHLVHMSSVGAYSPKQGNDPVDESWPTEGVPTSPYSQHKSAAERLLDTHEQARPDAVVTRLRPGIVGQRSAGSSLLRYGVPAAVPSKVIDLLPVLPLDRRLAIPMVHADDVADAIDRALGAKAPGAFNLSAEPAVTPHHIAASLEARFFHVPAPVLRAAMSLAWHARLQQVDPGWLDLGYAVPLMDTTRASRELGWSATVDAVSVLDETVSGMRAASADDTAVLRPRTVAGQLGRLVRRGPISQRRLP
ncbi:MAG: NAD-dependent epimerase/dehydratase family protein [Actinomycetota bacterium]|nr:NAD-dependent epimerase/dehydratase family protein [Actinomycetota bacterium]